jgi:hypothetical protein
MALLSARGPRATRSRLADDPGEPGPRRPTLDAYGRALEDYFGFGERRGLVPACFTREHIATDVNDLALRPNRRATAADGVAVGQSLANATLQQR